MSSVLRQLNSESLSKSNRHNVVLDTIHDLKRESDKRCNKISTNLENFSDYAFLGFVREYIISLDHGSQVIFYHALRDIEIRVTRTVTSLDTPHIEKVLSGLNRSSRKKLEEFDYGAFEQHYWELRNFVLDLKEASVSDIEILQVYDEEISVVKILRYMAQLEL